jgi:non-homologous end joining protein Ku
MSKKTYILVLWPESQIYMDYEWFDQECYLAPDDAGSSAYFIPEHRVREIMASDYTGLEE